MLTSCSTKEIERDRARKMFVVVVVVVVLSGASMGTTTKGMDFISLQLNRQTFRPTCSGVARVMRLK